MAARAEVRALLTRLAAAFPEWRPPDMRATLAEYEEALAMYPLELLGKAVKACRDSCEYFPKIAQIKRAAAELNANKDTRLPDFEKVPISLQIQAYLDEFREKMVKSGKWKERRRNL
jgi:hypothetical protein